MKKILSLVMTVIFCISLFSQSIVFAAEQPNYNIYEGYKSLKITCLNTDAFKYYGQTLTVQQNTDYTMTIWSRGGGSPSLRILTSSWSQTIKQVNLKGGTIWQENTATFNTGNNNVIVFTVTNNPYGGNGTMYVDNAVLAKTSDNINIVKNPGFEDGTKDWGAETTIFSLESSPIYINPGDEEIEYEENVIDQPNGNSSLNLYAGHRSLQYTASNTIQSVTQDITVAKNTKYLASFWVRSPESMQFDFNVIDGTSKGLLSGGQPLTISATPTWVRQQIEFTTTTDTKATFTLTSKQGQSGTLFIDYCMVVPKYKPAGMGMVNLIQNFSFEDPGSAWNGIEGNFTLYERTQGTIGGISGGVRLMPVGDSITAGVGATTDKTGYKKGLYDKYVSYGANVNFVGPSSLGSSNGFPNGSGHAGYSGWRVDQIEAQIENWMKLYEPQVILLHIGTNDILQDKAENNYAAKAPEKLESTVDKILSTNPDIELYLAAIIPLDNATNDAKVKTYNIEVERIANSKGPKVHYINMYNVVAKKDLVDYVHPGDAGYAKMAQKWFDETKDMVKSMTPSVFVPDEGTAYEGKYSLRYNPYYVSYYTLLTYEMFTRGNIEVEQNTNYTVSMMVKGDQGVSFQTRVQGSWSGDVIASNTTSAGPKWVKNEFSFNTGARTSVILAFINNCMTTGNMYIDNVEIKKEGTNENILSNPSFELDESGARPGWGNGNRIYSFIEDTTIKDPFHQNILIQKDGVALTKLETGQIDISADISSLNPTGYLIAALYQGNVLKNCSVSNEGTDLNVTISVDHVDGNTKLKIFIFDSMNNIRELMLPLTATQSAIK